MYGVEVPRTMSYRAKNEAVRVVLGDHVKQYKRLRVYLQTVIDINPGSRCIVATRMHLDNPSNNPRFHGMFMAMNASIQGFLNGCRPFIGLDGCFVKLTTDSKSFLPLVGMVITIYTPLPGLVGKEEKASWSWFLNQLKGATGEESLEFENYTIISYMQKSRASDESVATPATGLTPTPTAAPAPTPATSSTARPPKPPACSATRQAFSAPAPRPTPQAPSPRVAPQAPAPRAFIPPRSNPPECSNTYSVRPVRKKRVPNELNGYFTASRINEKSVEELQNEGK